MQQIVGAHMLCLGALRYHKTVRMRRRRGFARARTLAEMSTERGVVTLPEDATAEVATFRNAKAVRFTLSSSEEQATSDEERATCRSFGWRGDGLPFAIYCPPPPKLQRYGRWARRTSQFVSRLSMRRQTPGRGNAAQGGPWEAKW